MNRFSKHLALIIALLITLTLFPVHVKAVDTGFSLDQNRYLIAEETGAHVVTFTLPLAYNGVSASSLPGGITDFSITADVPESSNLFSKLNSSSLSYTDYGSGVFTYVFSTKGDAFNGTYTWPFTVKYTKDGQTVTETLYPAFKISNGQNIVSGPDHNMDGTINDGNDLNLQTPYDITLIPTPIAQDDKNGNVDLKVHLAYKGDKDFSAAKVSYFRIEPQVSGDTAVFPFEMELSTYAQTMENLVIELDEDKNVAATYFHFPLKVKKDAVNGYYPVTFKIYHLYWNTNLQEATPVETVITTYVEIRNGKKAGDADDLPAADPSTAILLLEGYTAEPAQIRAGDEFDLTLRIRNTSSSTVTDIKSTLTEANKTIIPVSGASSFFIEKIKAGETYEHTIRLKATSSAGVDPVELTLSNAFVQQNMGKTSSDTFILPVIQVSNLSLDPPSYPVEVYLGDSFNLMMNLYNKGKSRLYNVSVYLESDGMTADENYYAGNMESGTSKTYDVMVTPNMEGQITGDIVVTFEDAEGNVNEQRAPITLNVATMDWMMEEPYPVMPDDMAADVYPSQQGIPMWVWIASGAGIAVIGTLVIVLIVRAKKRKAALLEDDDEMD